MPHRYILKTHFAAEDNFRINYQDELTKEQLPVVTSPGGPVLVIAGAGSGKRTGVESGLCNLAGRRPFPVLLKFWQRR